MNNKLNDNNIKNAKNKMLPRYKAIAYIMLFLGLYIIGQTMLLNTRDCDFWMKVSARQQKDDVEILPQRGNILSCDGQFLATSMPEYKLHFDFVAGGERKDSVLLANMDSISIGLHEIFPTKSAAAFKKMLVEGRKKKMRNLILWKKKVTYEEMIKVKQLPVFNMGRNSGGFYEEKFIARCKPFGSLAERTIGDLFGSKDLPKCGLEMSYDSLLRGKSGKKQRSIVRGRLTESVIVAPENGCDILTTIDVEMQDIAEKALIDELAEIHADTGVAIVMEVATGDIKAMVNITRNQDGTFTEDKNHAVSDMMEPGSVFKTASLLVALDDGVVDTSRVVDTGNGCLKMYSRFMRDHNWRRGGYHEITLPQTLMYSSNVGVSVVIDEKYKHAPEKFVEGLRRVGIAEDLKLDIPGYAKPWIRMPKKDKTGRYVNWYDTALPWMSIGYETLVPPISVVSFYNAIANNGKMMRPRFVTKALKNGNVIKEYPTVVLKEKICGDKALGEIQTMLRRVVSEGTGKKAGSKSFAVAGKTGTAQIPTNGKYIPGAGRYLVSFVGYFPFESPRYTCIVCIQKRGLPASGGSMSGKVFHHIAEGVMAKDIKVKDSYARGDNYEKVPDVKAGNISAAYDVLDELNVNSKIRLTSDSKNIWGFAEKTSDKVVMSEKKFNGNVVPDVKGMGARDAAYLLQKNGIKVYVEGTGKVKEQSLAAGKKIIKGEICKLVLG